MLPTAYHNYHAVLLEKLNLAFGQVPQLEQAAECLAFSLRSKGWIYASGTGHSHLIAEEIFYRAGGFARVRALLLPELMLHQSATGSTEAERKEGYAPLLFEGYSLSSSDVVLISSNSGRNAVPIEVAAYAKERGAKVLVLTNLAHSKSVSSRHRSGRKLYELADVVLDNFGEIGDSALSLEGLDTKVGPTSSVICTALIQAICVEACAKLLTEGIVPEVFESSNSDQGAAHNEALLAAYKPLVKML